MRYRRYGAAVLALQLALPAAAQLGGDRQARILYAYQAEDANALVSLVQEFREQLQTGMPDPDLRYHLAHADYRLAELSSPDHAGDAEALLADCVDQLQPPEGADPESVEAMLLESLCDQALGAHRKMQSALLRLRAKHKWEAAARREPQNPRVLLIGAERRLAAARPGSAEAARGIAELELAAAAFERSSATRDDAPGWGHAQAYLELGHQCLMRGNFLAARNWVERALIAAPDYQAAQREMAALQSR